MRCHFCGKESFFEVCENCIKEQHPNRVDKIWKEDIKFADDLGQAYYDSLLRGYDRKIIEKNSKENFGFNVFCDGIRLGLDMIMPLLNEEGLRSAEKKIEDVLKIRRRAMNNEDVKMTDELENEENSLWEEGAFAETLGPQDIKDRMRTFHKKHDEDMNFNCKKCNKKISAHNKDWHAGLCDECFDKEVYNKE